MENSTTDEFTTHARGVRESLAEAQNLLKYLTANVTKLCDGALGTEHANAYCHLAGIATALLDAEDSLAPLISIEDQWREEAARKADAVVVARKTKRGEKPTTREARS